MIKNSLLAPSVVSTLIQILNTSKNLKADQETILVNELKNDPENRGYAPLLAAKDYDNLLIVLHSEYTKSVTREKRFKDVVNFVALKTLRKQLLFKKSDMLSSDEQFILGTMYDALFDKKESEIGTFIELTEEVKKFFDYLVSHNLITEQQREQMVMDQQDSMLTVLPSRVSTLFNLDTIIEKSDIAVLVKKGLI